MTRRALVGIGIAALASTWIGVVPASAEDAQQILLSSLAARPSFQGEQVAEMYGPLGRRRPGRPPIQRVFRDGNMMRIDFPGGFTVFDNGSELIRYRQQDNTYEKQVSSFLPQRSKRMAAALRKGHMSVELLGEDTVAGRAAWILNLKDNHGKLQSHKMWIDKEFYVMLRQDQERNDGTLSTRFLTISFTKPSPAQLAFVLPPTAQLAEGGLGRPLGRQAAMQMARRWGGLLEPVSVPPGYRLRAFYRSAVHGQQGLVAVYDGPRQGQSISVFQRPSLGSMGMIGPKKEGYRVLSAKKGTVDVQVVGPEAMPEADLQKVMGSIPEP
jgi:hypothetical protein